MKRLVIAIDCDDVLVDTAQDLLQFYNQKYGTSLDETNFYATDINPDKFGVTTFQEVIERFSERFLIIRSGVYRGVKWRMKLSELPVLSLRDIVYELMTRLPSDKVTTYGDLAAMAGSPQAARIVGGIAHTGPEELPWHRLVNAQGGLAIGYPGGQDVQRQLLLQDEIECDAAWHVKNFTERRWRP